MPIMKHKPGRYPGIRWSIIADPADPVAAFALSELQRAVQHRLPYVVEVEQALDADLRRERHLLLVGTAASSPALRELIARKAIPAPRGEEAYTVAVLDAPWERERKVVAIVGADPRGVLYGVQDFIARSLGGLPGEGTAKLRSEFDQLPACCRSEAPVVANRGVWTWGYVIYDYRRLFDNMARLRLNMVTIWNDVPPVNCAEVIRYAHERGIRVVLGFPWGWGFNHLDLANAKDRKTIRSAVLADFRTNYRGLDLDGIYFQTLTEHGNTHIGGRSVASLSCVLVNEIAADILKLRPALAIQFGLHASSIQDHYEDLKPLDPRVTIVWEDAGAIPYAYDPVPRYKRADWKGLAKVLESPQRTIDYSRKLATFRGRGEFALVPKGWMYLRWHDEFEHHGRFILGERDPEFIRDRLRERQPRWDVLNALWLLNYPLAARYYRAVLDCRSKRLTVTGLIEDGMLEEAIQPSVALFAETLWDPRQSDRGILERASSPYYRRGW